MALTLIASAAIAQEADMPAKFTAPQEGYDYIKRIDMVPMRDGAKLYTVIVIPKNAERPTSRFRDVGPP